MTDTPVFEKENWSMDEKKRWRRGKKILLGIGLFLCIFVIAALAFVILWKPLGRTPSKA